MNDRRKQSSLNGLPPAQGLYLPEYEHDACGVGFICHIKGKASNKTVSDALLMLERMNHRGGCGCDPNSGDGAGILTQLPDKFLRREMKKQGITLPRVGQYGVAQIFFPKDVVSRNICIDIIDDVLREYGMKALGWRDVPTNDKFVGTTPKKTEPKIRQLFVGMGETFFKKSDFDRRLYLVRQRVENLLEFGDHPDLIREGFYVNALSANRIIYKGMLTAEQLRGYYPDLSDPDFQASFAMVHSRFSTNTFPILAAGAPVSLPRSQRGNQYAPRQSQLDACSLQLTAIRSVRR